MNLWVFLTIASLGSMVFAVITIYINHRRKMKELELEALKVRKENLQAEVEDAVTRQLADQLSRIEVLEAIVTDKKYELSEKISRLKND